MAWQLVQRRIVCHIGQFHLPAAILHDATQNFNVDPKEFGNDLGNQSYNPRNPRFLH